MKENNKSSHSYSIIVLVLIMVIITLVIYIEGDGDSKEIAKEITTEMEMTIDSVKRPIITIFDPNTVELRQLLEMGLTKYQALSLLRYRASGKVFKIKEELISCYGFSDSLYFALEPYIVIGEEFQHKKIEPATTKGYQYSQNSYTESKRPAPLTPTKFLIDTVGIEYLKAIGALSQRQAEVFVKWRDKSGIHSIEELRECYTVSDSIATALSHYAIFTSRTIDSIEEPKLIDLNKADSTELRSVYGIGEKSVVAIMKYRDELGGFYSEKQLLELNVITDSNYEKIITQILIDSCDISKIDVNFALAKTLSCHPYIAPKLRRLLHKRELKGGWSTIGEMIEDKIFTEEEAQRVRPYLHFEVQPSLK